MCWTVGDQHMNAPVWAAALDKGCNPKGNFPAVRAKARHERGPCITVSRATRRASCLRTGIQSSVPSLLSVLCARAGVAQHRLTLLLADLMRFKWSQDLPIAVLQW